MMEGDTGEQWTSTLPALFIRVCKQGRNYAPSVAALLHSDKPHGDFLKKHAGFPDSFGFYLTYTSGRDPR